MTHLAKLIVALAVAIPAHAWASFVINGDGTVSDTATGLIWDRCPLGLSGAGCATGTASAFTWQQALVEVSTRNASNHLGFNDWRLPNIKELESLVDIGMSNAPFINTTAFPNTPIFAPPFWSSTTFGPGIRAFAISPGVINHFVDPMKVTTGLVRLVRSGQVHAEYDQLAPSIAGVCGDTFTSPTQYFYTAPPVDDLCRIGSASAIAANAATYNWTCSGQRGGSEASCRATRGYVVTLIASAGGTVSPPGPEVRGYEAIINFQATPGTGRRAAWAGTCGVNSSGFLNDFYFSDPIVSNCEVRVTFPEHCNLDFDGDSVLHKDDALILIRWLLGVRGEALVEGIAPFPMWTQSELAQFVSSRMVLSSLHDFDGDTQVLATTDGLLLLRLALGVADESLPLGATGSGAVRTVGAAVRAHVNSSCGTNFQALP